MSHIASVHPRFFAPDTKLRPGSHGPGSHGPVSYGPVSYGPAAEATPLRTRVAAADSGMHPAAVALSLGGFGLFLIASWVGWAFGYMSLLLAVIVVLSVMYFGLLLGGGLVAAAHRGETCQRSFRDFLGGRVQTLTGSVRGRDALIQIALMPIMLGCTMSFFALLWLAIR